MNTKLPIDAFEYYVSLGEGRSYQAVADHFDISKRTVSRGARRDGWTERLERIEREAQSRVDAKLTSEMEDLKLRHRKLLRAMASRAAQAIASFPLEDGMQGIKAADLVVRLERVLAGDPSQRAADIIAETTREEMRTLLTDKTPDEEDWSEFATEPDRAPGV